MINLNKLREKERDIHTVRRCPKCGKNLASNCSYLTRDYWGDFDCEAPEDDTFEFNCDNCKYLFCAECKAKV
jgi:hypothetical protein